jgi:hypothetical protein
MKKDVLVKLNRDYCGKSCIQQEEGSFTSKMELEIRKKLVKCHIWSTALYGAETRMLRAVDQKHLEGTKCGAGEGWRGSVG